MIFPEIAITVLFCEKILANESIFVSNLQRFADYKGYAKSLNFSKSYNDGPRKDIISMDATHFKARNKT